MENKTPAWRKIHGFDSIYGPVWSKPRLQIERGMGAARIKASFKSKPRRTNCPVTKDEVKLALKQYGMTQDYRASWDAEDGKGVILFKTGKCSILDGTLKGTQIILADGLITVWTSKVKKARVFTKGLGIKLRELTGECEFSVPASIGDKVLPVWGARVKRVLTDEHKARLAVARQGTRFAAKRSSNEALA